MSKAGGKKFRPNVGSVSQGRPAIDAKSRPFGCEKPVEGAAQGEFYQEPDQYSPRQAQPPSGLYWVEPGENGPRIRQDGATPAQED